MNPFMFRLLSLFLVVAGVGASVAANRSTARKNIVVKNTSDLPSRKKLVEKISEEKTEIEIKEDEQS